LYCFDRVFSGDPSADETRSLSILDTCAIVFSMDGCLVDGRWSRLGSVPEFRRQDWFVPPTAGFQESRPWRPESGWFIDVTEDEELRSVRLDADGFASPEECRMMPRCDALWSSDGAEIVADKAIRDRDPRYRFTASAESVRVWSVYSTSQGGGEVSSR
jgi:hypothetical protein